MIYLTRKIEFSASHLYHNPAFSAEENRRVFGKCNNPHGHGHNYVLEVTVAGTPDPNTGMVLDLKELKEILQREIIERMDHRFLNYEVPELAGQIPTCENIAPVIWNLLDPKIPKGRVDPATGMVAHLGKLDEFVAREVLETFDHKNLNEEIATFRERVPTTENLCIEIYNRLRAFPGARLERVRLEETSLNTFEYFGERQGSR